MVWILIAVLGACTPAAAAHAETPFDECVRFHVIAEDNTDEAQALKLRVRDSILDNVQLLFEGCTDSEKAWETARENIGAIEAWARDAARENGFEGTVRAVAEICSFPDREYEGMTVPAGEYRTVRIVIGEGKGENWWCVLYPSLCMPEGYEPGMKVEFYSSIFRWFKTVFGGTDHD